MLWLAKKNVGGGATGTTYAQNNDEQKVDIRNVVELEPKILWYETQRRVFGGSYLVSRVVCSRMALLVALSLG